MVEKWGILSHYNAINHFFADSWQLFIRSNLFKPPLRELTFSTLTHFPVYESRSWFTLGGGVFPHRLSIVIHGLEWGRETEREQIEKRAPNPVFHLTFFLWPCDSMVYSNQWQNSVLLWMFYSLISCSLATHISLAFLCSRVLYWFELFSCMFYLGFRSLNMLNDKWILTLDFIKWGQNDKSALKLNHLARLKYVQVKVILIWLGNKLERYIKKI